MAPPEEELEASRLKTPSLASSEVAAEPRSARKRTVNGLTSNHRHGDDGVVANGLKAQSEHSRVLLPARDVPTFLPQPQLVLCAPRTRWASHMSPLVGAI